MDVTGALHRILIVDDEEDILVALRGYLQSVLPKAEIRTAGSGADGLRLLEDAPADLVLTDYKMPGMDGMQFLAQVRRLHPETPCVLMTAYPDMELAIKALNEQRIQHFFTKPIEPDAIGDVVKALLVERMARRQREAALARSLQRLRQRSPGPAAGEG